VTHMPRVPGVQPGPPATPPGQPVPSAQPKGAQQNTRSHRSSVDCGSTLNRGSDMQPVDLKHPRERSVCLSGCLDRIGIQINADPLFHFRWELRHRPCQLLAVHVEHDLAQPECFRQPNHLSHRLRLAGSTLVQVKVPRWEEVNRAASPSV
jgi:hypothetical protein